MQSLVRLFWSHFCKYHERMNDVIPTYVRLPVDLKEKIDEAADKRSHSRNKEILERLYSSFVPSKGDLASYDTGDLIGELLKRYPKDEIMIRIGKKSG